MEFRATIYYTIDVIPGNSQKAEGIVNGKHRVQLLLSSSKDDRGFPLKDYGSIKSFLDDLDKLEESIRRLKALFTGAIPLVWKLLEKEKESKI